MSAPSPALLATSLPAMSITSNGKALDSTIQVVAVDIWNGVNRLPKARLVVSDGSAASQDFPISETSTLIPGATIVIAMGYGSSLTTVFSGVVYRQGLEVSANGPSRLVVEATDQAMVMTLSRSNASFQNQTDSQVCRKIITAAGLKAAVTATSAQHASLVQYYASDWDLLVMRAQYMGMVVTVAGGTVTVAPPDTNGKPVLSLAFGESILTFRAAMDASTQYTPAAVVSYAWDPAKQALAKSGSAQASVTTPGNLSSAQLAQVFKVSKVLQQTPGALEVAELTQWSSAELMLSQLSKIRGEVSFQGSALATPGSMVTLAGLGSRFNGNGYVACVHHRMAEGLWRTTVELGLSPNSFAATAAHVTAPGAAGQLPPANELQIGVVKQIDKDPDGEFRVLVTLPALQAASAVGVWARFGAFYASAGIGACFYPEIGDEVVVGFLGADPRYAVVLGSLYSKKHAPPNAPAAVNNTKSLVSKSKLRIDFLEDRKAIKILTPGQQSVVIDDQAKSVTLTDVNGNSVKLDASGITIDSVKDVKITAKGAITLDAKGALSATGKSSAKLNSSGAIRIKGTTVAIN
jgi:Rhs element Vgr protein